MCVCVCDLLIFLHTEDVLACRFTGVGGVVLCRCVCVCDLLIFLQYGICVIVGGVLLCRCVCDLLIFLQGTW